MKSPNRAIDRDGNSISMTIEGGKFPSLLVDGVQPNGCDYWLLFVYTDVPKSEVPWYDTSDLLADGWHSGAASDFVDWQKQFDHEPTDDELDEAWELMLDVVRLSDEEMQWFWDRGCNDFVKHEGHPFVIIDSTDTEKHPAFVPYLSTVLCNAPKRDSAFWRDDYWGYSDMYTYCQGCHARITWQPSSGMADSYWAPDDGEILCKKCTQDNASEYLEWYHEQLRRGKVNEFLLDFAENKYTLVLPHCQNGLHEGDNDDPKPIARWARENGWDVAFDVWSDQFTVYFDVYFRYWDEDEWEARELTEEEVAQIREALCTSVDINQYHSYCTLRHEFRQWPSPADRAKAMLRGYN